MSLDLVELGGYLFGAWASGYVCGFLVYGFKRLTDKI